MTFIFIIWEQLQTINCDYTYKKVKPVCKQALSFEQ